ncbi:MAG TPA: hypothetical protein VLG47_07935 [Candidatus Saccharimonadales bacterium]|nr:hypothetical protein [Candidatus Saccharimonadales bacterium]
MSNSILALFGVASAAVTIGGFIPYVISIVKHTTKPERASWWIWSFLMTVTLIVQIEQGSTWSLFLTATYLVANVIIAGLSVKYGYGKLELKDKLSIAAALLGVLLWHFADSPTGALLVFISIDLIGNILTYQKTWKSPKSEN